ncbi:unnamed protein product [Cladocopium goreaui]|uniref:Uncharacterized protein n=1 Tax=Cladocopium goreaui TaxID=2562237 RepID=A0A9P1FRY7_9DINO|nr:unnamed protein product [Cladocopium goreaui]
MRTDGRKVTALAYELHRSVPADHWCVTYWDLLFLRQEVQSALRCGEIQPGLEDDVSEDYGPSIYTVNEQYIKPVTQDAGKMSWALMRNPDGLQCDLFINHAWQEGVFEFLAKVRHSWPRSVQTAWCCMLANPQNLDIASFLQSPKSSPFAIALQASKVMLVVPNRQESVYTRLWCAYEAYLAQEEGKTILIAHSSNLHQILAALRGMALAAIFGASVGIVATLLNLGQTYGVPALACLVVGSSLVIHDDVCRRVMHLLGEILCWTQVTHGFVNFFDLYSAEEYPDKDKAVPHKVTQVLHLSYWVMTSLAFCVMEVDRINARSAVSEAEELRQGYQGSIQYAKCSQAADAASIRREIGTQVDRVDHAIHVLLTAGMSTPALRDIAHRVDIEHAAFAEFTGAVFLLGPFATMAVTLSFVDLFYGRCLWQRVVLAVMSLLSRLILFVWLSWSHWDEQRFILKVMNKFLCLAMLGWLGLMFCFLVFGLSLDNVFLTWLLITDLCLLSMLLFAFLGVRGIAKLPCGFRILQICFSRGCNACNARTVCALSNLAADDDESSETE